MKYNEDGLRVKEFDNKNKKIVIEEEKKKKHPLLLFFFNHKLLFLMLLLFALMFFVIGLQLAISSLKGSIDPSDVLTSLEMNFHDGTGDVNLNGNKPFTDDDAKRKLYEKYGNIGLKDGVILEVKTITLSDKTIIYYSDGSAMIINKNGSIVRVSSLEDGSFGVDDKGNIKEGAKTLNVRLINTVNLKDKTIIKYYSDGSAEITCKGKKVFVRDGSTIKLSKNNEYIIKINPSGISFLKEEKKLAHNNIRYYSDGTIKVTIDNKEYVIRNDKDIKIDGNNISFPNNNAAVVIDTKNLDDGTIVKYYSDGSAEVIKNDGETIFVRQSGDILYKNNERIREIIEDNIGHKIYEKDTPNGDKVIIFDDGSAVIVHPNGSKEYVDENSDIKYDENGNIKDIEESGKDNKYEVVLEDGTVITIYEDGDAVIDYPNGDKKYVNDYDDIKFNEDGNIKTINGETSNPKNKKTLPDGTIVTEFENGVIEVVEPDGDRYLIKDTDIVYDEDGNIDKINNNENKDVDKNTLPDGTVVTEFEDDDKVMIEYPDGTVVITDKDNINYDEDGNIEDIDTGLVEDMEDKDDDDDEIDNDITITNPTNKDLKYRLVIEETDNYSKYNVKRLPADFVKYQVDVDYNNSTPKYLNNNIWTMGDILEGGLKIEKDTYILYEGIIDAKSSVDINLSLWLDYENMTNENQNSAFIGTIKAYAWIDETSN